MRVAQSLSYEEDKQAKGKAHEILPASTRLRRAKKELGTASDAGSVSVMAARQGGIGATQGGGFNRMLKNPV
jgi:hypothetical protein